MELCRSRGSSIHSAFSLFKPVIFAGIRNGHSNAYFDPWPNQRDIRDCLDKELSE